MYPEITLSESGFKIYFFGVFLSISILLFLWMFQKVTRAVDGRPGPVMNNLLWYFLGTFLGARIGHIILFWGIPGKSSFSLAHPFLSFVTMSDYYFSLAGALIGFILVMQWSLKDRDIHVRRKAYDSIILASLFAIIFGYLGSFLGGQTYGIESRGSLSIDYSLTNPYLGEFPLFPLAMVYVFLTGIIFSICYMFRKANHEDGITAFLGVAMFSIMLIIGEFFNASSRDNISSLFGVFQNFRFLNATQLVFILLLLWSARHLIVELDLPVGLRVKRFFGIHPPKTTKTKKTRQKRAKQKK